jgi:hypothetical protein
MVGLLVDAAEMVCLLRVLPLLYATSAATFASAEQ